jgi:2-C-methyl-D-erythritol 4-phosphate cytidylyltransferase
MSQRKARISTIILAAGDSKRFSGQPVPKQLLPLNGRPTVSHCLDIYQQLDCVNDIILVINEKFRKNFESVVEHAEYSKIRKIVTGGKTRQESIFIGLESTDSCDYVVIQNGVSVLTSHELISKCIKAVKKYRAVSAFVHETYTSFLVHNNRIDNPVDRNLLGHVRDPQVFEFSLIKDAHEWALRKRLSSFTNDILLMKEFGQEVYLVESPPNNFKITTYLDLKLAEILLKEGA